MIDIETLGRNAGCVVLSIAAVEFSFDYSCEQLTSSDGFANPKCVNDMMTFYYNLNVTEQLLEGAFIDPATLRWWLEQSSEAQEVLLDAFPIRVKEVLCSLTQFLQSIGPKEELRLWSQGTDFDISILRFMFNRYIGADSEPWYYKNIFDARTYIQTYGALFSSESPYAPIPKFKDCLSHSAISDAIRSAYNVCYLGSLFHEKINVSEL